MCLTAHFIDNEWKLKKKVLCFSSQESHRGVDIGKMVEKCLMEWEIENVFTISVDNASANDVTIEFKKNLSKFQQVSLKWEMDTHEMCCPHFKFSGARWHKKS